MARPPLYKYLDVTGAKLTLGNYTFKHAKPSDFNDTEDLTIQSIFPDETEAALEKLSNGFTDVIVKHIDDPPTCAENLRDKIALLQRIYRQNPGAADAVKKAVLENPELKLFDVEHIRARSEAFVKEMNEFMQGYRVLCVSTHNDSDQMWSEYAGKHSGIALRIEPNVARDSKFQLFRPVVYREARPPLYDDTLDFLAGSLFGNQEERRRAMLDKIIYAKTMKWHHEGEYRLVIAVACSGRRRRYRWRPGD